MPSRRGRWASGSGRAADDRAGRAASALAQSPYRPRHHGRRGGGADRRRRVAANDAGSHEVNGAARAIVVVVFVLGCAVAAIAASGELARDRPGGLSLFLLIAAYV